MAPYGGYGGYGGYGVPTAAVVYAQPVAPAPIVVGGWGGGCGGCGGGWGGGGWGGGGCGGCRGVISAWGAPSPLYVVNQGPAYTGPGLMVPYGGYTPDTAYAPAADYPYVPGYGVAAPSYNPYFDHLHYRPRYAYRGPVYVHGPYRPAPRYYRPRHWHQWRG
jgi:hypothetical protein